ARFARWGAGAAARLQPALGLLRQNPAATVRKILHRVQLARVEPFLSEQTPKATAALLQRKVGRHLLQLALLQTDHAPDRFIPHTLIVIGGPPFGKARLLT